MSIGAMMANYTGGFFYTGSFNTKKAEDTSAFEQLAENKAQECKEAVRGETNRTDGGKVPYTRCITANIKTREMVASSGENGEMIYSYRSTEQHFSILINSNGSDKKYTIQGTDENGEKFEREFNPYDVDPKDADFPEFSALCLYLKQTDETADLLANEYFGEGDIFEKKDYMGMLEDFASDEIFLQGRKMMECAFELVNSLHDFAARRLGLASMPDQESIDKLLTDRSIKADQDIPDTVVTNHTEYTDPKTAQIVPVDVKYITAYSENGISCKEILKDGDKKRTRDLWSIDFQNEDDLYKVREFLKGFNNDQNLTFASNEGFWRDFLEGKVDVERFKEYYASTNNGVIDFEGEMQKGRKLRDILSDEYAGYVNNQHFVGQVFTEQEMWDNWYAQIEASQKAARADGSGIEPPKETIITTDNKVGVDWEPYGRTHVEMLVKQYGEDSPYAKALRAIEQSFDATFPGMPDYIKDDWIEMCIDSGMNQITGISFDGKDMHISQIMIQKFVNDYNLSHGNYQYADFGWGKSVESMIRILNKGIHDIDFPLAGQPEHSEDVKKMIANERSFYVDFLKKIGAA